MRTDRCCLCRLIWNRTVGAYWNRLRGFSTLLVLHLISHFFAAWNAFAWTVVLIQYLSRNLGLTDSQASTLYSFYGAAMTIYSMITGLAVDYVGVFQFTLTGAIGGFLSKGAFVLIGSDLMHLSPQVRLLISIALLMTLIPVSDTIILQMGRIGVKRYTTEGGHDTASFESFQRADEETTDADTVESFEYAFRYSLDNIASFLAFGTVALGNAFFPTDESSMNRMAMLSTLPVLCGAIITAMIGIRKDTYNISLSLAEAVDQDLSAQEHALKVSPSYLAVDRDLDAKQCRGLCASCMRQWYHRNATLLKFIVLSMTIIAVKTLFRHLEVTMPKYTQRKIDPNFPYALLLMINPAMVIVLASPMAGALKRFPPYRVIIIGTIICCTGSILMIYPHIASILTSVAIFSLGEVVWSPLLDAFLMKIAPRGREGSLGAFVTLPLFMASFPVGLLSGFLLEYFCPSSQHCHSYELWGTISACAFATPVGLVCLQRWLEPRGNNKNNGELEKKSKTDTGESDDDDVTVYTKSGGEQVIRKRPSRMNPSGELGETPRED